MFASSLACGRAISSGRPRRGGWRDEHAAEVPIGCRRTAEGAEGREPGVSAVPCPPPRTEHGIRTNKGGGGGPGRSGDGQAGSHESVLKRVLVVALLREGQLGTMISSCSEGRLDNCRVCTLRAGTGEKWRQVDKMTPPWDGLLRRVNDFPAGSVRRWAGRTSPLTGTEL